MDISIKDITKTYGPQKALDKVSCDVKGGEILGFLGPNGAGKTTLMKIITCYMAPTSGDITVGGISIHEAPDKIKPNIGYLPEDNPLYTDLHVIDYLNFVATLQNVPRSKIEERVQEMIRLCGIDREKHKKIGELSKGFRQRVGLAQAMIHDPEILILDEPTSGLDPNQIVEIRELIKKLGKQKTVILSTHILPEVEASCDRILILNEGQIVADGTPNNLINKAKGQEVVKATIEGAEKDTIYKALSELQSAEMVDVIDDQRSNGVSFKIQSKPDKSSRKNIFQLCVDQKWVLTELTPQETRLEDVFRELTEA